VGQRPFRDGHQIYPPGSFAKTEELVDLAKIVAHYRTIYASHIRGEGATLMEALDEAIRIGKMGDVRVEVSHLKAMGKDNWGRGKEALLKLEEARQGGVDIATDQYPYEATSTSLTALVPQWAHTGGIGELLRRLASPETTERLQTEILFEINRRGGPKRESSQGIPRERYCGKEGFHPIQKSFLDEAQRASPCLHAEVSFSTQTWSPA
jgi:N-acyl-D-amino-acid deacylase